MMRTWCVLALGLLPSLVSASPARLPTAASCGPAGHWTTLSPPRARGGSVAVYDGATAPDPAGRMIVFGGSASGDQDAWALSLSDYPAWTLLNSASPLPASRLAWSGVLDRTRDRVILFGGWDFSQGVYVTFNDTWTFSLVTGEWAPLATTGTPPGRVGASMIYDPVHDRVILFGGYVPAPTIAYFGDVWQLSLSGTPAWTQLAPGAPSGAPSARYQQAAVYDPVGNQMLVFGGNLGVSPFGPTNELWSLQLTPTTEWLPRTPAGPIPSARTCTAIWDPAWQCLTLFGGMGAASTYLGDVWRYFPGSNNWAQMPTSGAVPTPRAGHFAVYDARHAAMIVYGGQTASASEAVTEEIYRLDSYVSSGVWSFIGPEEPLPSPRVEASAIVDPLHERLVIMGGLEEKTAGSDSVRSDTWVQDLANQRWQQVSPGTGPPSRHLHDAFWDADASRMLVFGGNVRPLGPSHQTPNYPHDLWSLTFDPLPAWTQHLVGGTPPASNQRFIAAFDPVRRRLLAFRHGTGNAMEVHSLSLTPIVEWAPLAIAGPSPPGGATRVFYDPARDRVVVYRGPSSAPIWYLSLGGVPTWSSASPTGSFPSISSNFSPALLDPVGDRLVISYNGQTSSLALQTLAWCALTPLGAQPPSFHGRTVAYDPLQQRALFFTGAGEVRVLQWGSPVEVPPVPERSIALSPPRPNPSRGDVSFDLALDAPAVVRASAYDLQGREVRSIASSRLPAGRHVLHWDGRDDYGRAVTSGIYFVQARVGDAWVRRKVLVTR